MRPLWNLVMCSRARLDRPVPLSSDFRRSRLPALLTLVGLCLTAAAASSPLNGRTQQFEKSPQIDEPCAAFEERLAAVATPEEECRVVLLVARCLLVEQSAPRLSMRCLEATAADDLLAKWAHEGLAMLENADQALDRARRESEPAIDPDALSDITDRLEMLRAFGGMFAALASDPAEESTRTKLLAACGALAVQFDNDNPKIAASAKLWTSVAYRMAGRPERALQLLRPLLIKPEDPCIGLATRLQYCLALGDRGEYAAALAVCSRIETRAQTWFADEERVTRRRSAAEVRCTRIKLLRDWAKKLREADEPDRAADAAAQAERLLGSESWPPLPEHRLILAESVAGLPNWDTRLQPPSTSSAPASTDRAGEND